MKLTTILLLGATALTVPAFAAGNDASTSTQASASTTTAQPATNADTSSNTDSNGKMAMNTSSASSTSGSADISALSSVPDTQKKYKRSSRASDFNKEAETTKQLNQQVASAGGLPKTQ
jgi:hypothetical protein